jgi:acetyltransferase
MLQEQLKNYRSIVTLKDGANVLLRLMTPDDEQRLVALFEPIDEEDLLYFRDRVKDPAVIQEWCRSLDYNRVLPMLALVKDRVVGQTTLHFMKGPKRHIGEVRIFMAKDFRRRGLGTKLLHALIDLARKQDLHVLYAEAVTEQTRVIKAFQNQGFKLQTVYEDFYMLPDGDTRDVAMLVLHLKQKSDEF